MTISLTALNKTLSVRFWLGQFRAPLPVMFTEIRSHQLFMEIDWCWLRFSVDLARYK